MSGSARAMEAHYERFMGTVRARQNEIEKACMGILQRSFELDRLRKETSNQWRLDRAVRRFSRREMARDCRQRARRYRRLRRRRKVIGQWWLESISSRFRVNEQGFYVPYASNGGREVVIGVLDDPIKVAP